MKMKLRQVSLQKKGVFLEERTPLPKVVKFAHDCS